MMRRMKNQRGFTLVELMIVVAIIGILAALAVYGVKRYLTSAKTAEAKEMLGRIGKDATAAYQREQMDGSILALGATRDAVHALCPSTSKVPATTPSNQKYQSDPDEWKDDVGWKCLKFSINDPQYYSYQYTATGTGEGSSFAALAYGNLDGDTETPDATFTLVGQVEKGEARVAPTITDSEE